MLISTQAMKFGFLISAVCGLSTVVDGAQVRDDVFVLMYETDDTLQNDPKSPLYFFQQRGKVANLQTTVFGGKLAYHGFGDKYQTLKPLLEVADQNKLVILADARDVILNVPDNEAFASLAVDNFLQTYKKLTADAPNAIVMSAEAQCCVSAMAHAHPSEYFDPVTKERTRRACSSGKEDCLWFPSPNIDDWQSFMEDLAFKTTGEDLSDTYLNAGLMAGYPADLINLLDVIDIDPSEDDQAVLSGLMYQFPDMIKLDYKQEMFGNNQWPRGLVDGCVFDTQGKHLSLIHTETGTEPLILHTPGKFYDCLDVLIEDLGGVSQQRYLLGLDHMNDVATDNGFFVTSHQGHRELSNYGVSNYGNYGNYGASNYSPADQRNYGVVGTSTSVNSVSANYGNYGFSHSQRRLGFLSKVHEMIRNIKDRLEKKEEDVADKTEARVEIEDETPAPIVIVTEPEISNYGVVETEPEPASEPVAASEPTNYDNYGVAASNYGNYGVAKTADNYGVADAPIVTEPEVSNYGVVETEPEPASEPVAASEPTNYDNYGVAASNYGNYGVARTADNYGVADAPNYGNYDVADSSRTNYGASNYGNYGVARRLRTRRAHY